MKLHNLFKQFAPAVLLLSLSMASASASPIFGSLPFSGFSVTQDGADLAASTFVSSATSLTSGPGSDDYSGIPVTTVFGPTTLTFASILNGGGFSLSNATWGIFTATSGEFTLHSASGVNVFLQGIYTPGLPGASCSVCTVTSTTAHVSINQSGSSLSEAITITSPAPAFPGVPEPATTTLFGSALVALGLFGRKCLAR